MLWSQSNSSSTCKSQRVVVLLLILILVFWRISWNLRISWWSVLWILDWLRYWWIVFIISLIWSLFSSPLINWSIHVLRLSMCWITLKVVSTQNIYSTSLNHNLKDPGKVKNLQTVRNKIKWINIIIIVAPIQVSTACSSLNMRK